jgi:hypothetical protein
MDDIVDKNLDRGYAWVILVAAFIGFSLQGSVLFTMTLMYE